MCSIHVLAVCECDVQLCTVRVNVCVLDMNRTVCNELYMCYNTVCVCVCVCAPCVYVCVCACVSVYALCKSVCVCVCLI